MIRTPFDTLAEYERRSLAHAVAQPAREIAHDQHALGLLARTPEFRQTAL